MSTYREDMRRAWDRINSFPTQRLQTRFGTIEYADHRGTSVSATMSFDELGRLTDFIAPRYRHLGRGRFSLEEWARPRTTARSMACGCPPPVEPSGIWTPGILRTRY